MKRYTLLLISVIFAGFALFSCSGNGDGNQGAPGEKKPWIIGFSQCTVSEPWRQEMNNQMIAAAKKYPEIELKVLDGEDDTQKQVASVESFLIQEIDLLIISPKEDAPLTKIVKRAYDKGIPVIVLDRKIQGESYTTFIGANNLVIGKKAGEYILEILEGKGTIVELKGNMYCAPGRDRHNGFREAIKEELESGKITILHDTDCDWKEDKARAEMEAALVTHPDIDLVYGHNDPMAHGAYQAAKQAGRAKDIIFIGIDALPHEGVAYVKEGAFQASLEYPTGATEAIDTAIKILNGEKVPKNIPLGSKIYTKEGVRKIE